MLGDSPGGTMIRLDGRIVLTEQLGAQQLVELRVGDCDVMAAGVDPDLALRSGDAGRFFINLERVHLFEPGDSGAVIWSAGNGKPAAPAAQITETTPV